MSERYMVMEKNIHIPRSSEETEDWQLQQYLSMTPEERLDELQRLREEQPDYKNVEKKGIQKVYRIIKLK